MHNINQFVITGGPCAGKSTCLSYLENKLTEKGFKTIIIAETPTEILSSGISFVDLPNEEFQTAIINNQLQKEKTALKAAEIYAKSKPVVILYDRGITDAKAYMTYDEYYKVLSQAGLNEISARDRYDAVFHLVTAAEGAEEFYTKANNEVRRETAIQARSADKKTMDAWVGAPHFRVIDNSTDFEMKVKRLAAEIFATLGLPSPLEIENKYLIQMPNLVQIMQSNNFVKSQIYQTYLRGGTGLPERRIRQRGIDNYFSYYYTEKFNIPGKPNVRQEVQRKISDREYLSYMIEGDFSIYKDRYCFVHDGQYFELDIYPELQDRAILEIELTQENQIVNIPPFINVINEVTGDPAFKNINISKMLLLERLQRQFC
jgi:CYTH domain-containing protein/predicted ATPase